MPPGVMSADPSIISILPIVITLVLSLLTRNVIVGLFLGVASGVLLLNGLNPFSGMKVLVGDYLVGQVTDATCNRYAWS